MTNVEELTCFECGGTMRRLARAGRMRPYRGAGLYEVPADLKVLTCGSCGTEAEAAEESAYLDEVFEEEYTRRQTRASAFLPVQLERRRVQTTILARLSYTRSQNVDLQLHDRHPWVVSQ